MQFTSFIFPLFLLTVLILYYALPERFTWILLLCASWFFYAYHNIQLFLLLPAFSLTTYLSALLSEKLKNEKARRFLFVFTLLLIFGTLFFFKYLDLFVNSAFSIAEWLRLPVDTFTLSIVLPVGISFYTFQTASYVIDVYLGKIKAERHFGYYALFVSFFPQLVAGPIERTENLLPQLKKKHPFKMRNIRQGIAMMTAGFLKKVVVADVVAKAVDSVYNAGDISSLSSLAVLVASMLFFVQIYCDFSGYSDIAVGTARMMGIRLMQNFNRPFSSESVGEFWSRWHVSLSGWFNEYVYQPLSFRSFRKKNKLFYYGLHTSIVMLLSGFWHGAEWSYLLWGGLLALYQIVERVLKRKFPKKGNAAWNRIRTFLLLTLSMILFRASDVSTAFALYARLFTGWNLSAFFEQTALTAPYIAVILLGIALMIAIDRFVTADGGEAVAQREGAFLLFASVITIFIAWSFLVASGQENAFIYFQF